MNGTQADETLRDGAMADETAADGGAGMDTEKLRRIRLRGFLRELVRQEGKMEAAELLGVNYKTLARAEETGKITGRMGDALERLLGTGDDPEVTRLRERVAALEGGMRVLEKELRDGLGEIRAVVGGDAEAQEGKPDDAPPVAGLRSRKPVTERPLDPEVVTVEPAEDDIEVYGAAWPLVEEWRRLRDGHPHQGTSLSWLAAEERLLVLELAMLEEHGLTLPPEKQPLQGFGRRGQTTHRWKALADTRVRLRRRKLLRWVRRVLTLGLWWH